MSIQQMYFIIHRFVQVTGAKWRFNCLALLKKELPLATTLRPQGLKQFEEIELKLQPTCFEFLYDCPVGYFKVNGRLFHTVGIAMYGSVIEFRPTESRIESPVVLEVGELFPMPKHKDPYNMCIH